LESYSLEKGQESLALMPINIRLNKKFAVLASFSGCAGQTGIVDRAGGFRQPTVPSANCRSEQLD
jgi:hypothetical protein